MNTFKEIKKLKWQLGTLVSELGPDNAPLPTIIFVYDLSEDELESIMDVFAKAQEDIRINNTFSIDSFEKDIIKVKEGIEDQDDVNYITNLLNVSGRFQKVCEFYLSH